MKKILIRRIEALRNQRANLEQAGNIDSAEYRNCVVRLGELDNLYFEFYGVTYRKQS